MRDTRGQQPMARLPPDPGLAPFVERVTAGHTMNRGILNPGAARMQNVARPLIQAWNQAGIRRAPMGFRQPQAK